MTLWGIASRRSHKAGAGCDRHRLGFLANCGLNNEWPVAWIEDRAYGSTFTIQVLLYSKKEPKAACVFLACKAKVCVPGVNGGCMMPMP